MHIFVADSIKVVYNFGNKKISYSIHYRFTNNVLGASYLWR